MGSAVVSHTHTHTHSAYRERQLRVKGQSERQAVGLGGYSQTFCGFTPMGALRATASRDVKSRFQKPTIPPHWSRAEHTEIT